MKCLLYLYDFILFVIDNVQEIYLPTGVAITTLYLPIFLLSVFNHSITKLSKWILTIPIVVYVLWIPTCQPIRSIPLFNTCTAGIAIYYAQKVCEWILIRRNEFCQWSFFDIHHELFYYRVYTQSVSMRKLKTNKKEIFFSGPIRFDEHVYSLICISCNIIKYYLLLDLTIYFISEVFKIIVNQLSGCVVYLFLMFNYEILRHTLCFLFNRPLALIPDLFRQPYRATSPIDFWARWHQVFKNTWTELIFKPVLTFIHHQWPCLPKFVSYGISLMCVFLFSGVIHEYVIYITFNKFTGDQIKFFLLQGSAVLIGHAVNHQFPRLCTSKPIGFVFTFIFNGITAGYFLKPWIPYFSKKHTLKYSSIDFVMRNFFNKY